MASLLEEYRRQQMWNNLSRLGQGLLAASAGRMPVGQGLALGLSQMQPVSMQEMRALREEEERQKQQAARATLMGGYDPTTKITWNQPRAGVMGAPEGGTLMAQAFPDETARAFIQSLQPPKPYTDIAKLNADLEAGRISQAQFETASKRLGRPEKTQTLTGRMRWIMATGRDPSTGREYTEEERGMFARAMAPGSAMTREDFLRNWVLANARNFRTGPEVIEEGNNLYDSFMGIEPEALPRQEFGTVEAATPPGLPETEDFGYGAPEGPAGIPAPQRKPEAILPRGRMQEPYVMSLPGDLRPDIKERADTGTFTEADLMDMQVNDPDQFELLYRYLKGE